MDVLLEMVSRRFSLSPHLRLSLGLVALLVSIALVADLLGLLPKPEIQMRDARKTVGEALAVQLSSAAARNQADVIHDTVRELVQRNDNIQYAGLFQGDVLVTEFGQPEAAVEGVWSWFDTSGERRLTVPIYRNSRRWGEVRIEYAPSLDPASRYLGMSSKTITYMTFLSLGCLLAFYFFMRRALIELNPSKVVPQRVNAAFDVLAEGVLIIDEEEHIVMANSAFADRLGMDPQRMVGRDPAQFAWDLKGSDVEMLPWQLALRDGENITGMPLRLVADPDHPVTFTVNCAAIDDGQGDRKGVLATFDDVSPVEAKNAELAKTLVELSATQKLIEQQNKELELLATRDPLTGCLNRRSFMSFYEKHFTAASNGAPLVVMMVDIDHFKNVNDTYGHGVGDLAIKLVADTLESCFREQDAVGRFGGEEFVVSISGASLEKGALIADRVRQIVSRNVVKDENLPMEKMTVSIGVAQFGSTLESPETLLEMADKALYVAKETGRNRVCKYDPSVEVLNQAPHELPAQVPSPQGGIDDETVDSLRHKLEELRTVVHNQAEEITQRSMFDDITGLPNRFLLVDRLSQAVKQSERKSNFTAVVSISLSGYKHLLDYSGAEAADQLLRQASQRIENSVRNVDTIGVSLDQDALTLSCIAQNELAVLLVDMRSVEEIPKVVARITEALQPDYQINSQAVVTGVHTGISVYPHDGSDPNTLLRNASLARTHAVQRSSGNAGSAFFCKDIDDMAIKHTRIAADLRAALDNNELSVVYQPKTDALTNRVIGVEALARWSHREMGPISPLEFIMVAEQIGLIGQVTTWVLDRVCNDIRCGKLGNVPVSVNVSPAELCDFSSVSRIIDMLAFHSVSPEQIEIEITESSMLNNYALVREILNSLREAGIRVALDDFGTAYSSLNLLVEIPVDIIKIDRSFVSNIQDDSDNRAVVTAIANLAQAMGKDVVAEGVENASERDCLLGLGCTKLQGYFYSKPLTLDHIASYVEQHNGVSEPLLLDNRSTDAVA